MVRKIAYVRGGLFMVKKLHGGIMFSPTLAGVTGIRDRERGCLL